MLHLILTSLFSCILLKIIYMGFLSELPKLISKSTFKLNNILPILSGMFGYSQIILLPKYIGNHGLSFIVCVIVISIMLLIVKNYESASIWYLVENKSLGYYCAISKLLFLPFIILYTIITIDLFYISNLYMASGKNIIGYVFLLLCTYYFSYSYLYSFLFGYIFYMIYSLISILFTALSGNPIFMIKSSSVSYFVFPTLKMLMDALFFSIYSMDIGTGMSSIQILKGQSKFFKIDIGQSFYSGLILIFVELIIGIYSFFIPESFIPEFCIVGACLPSLKVFASSLEIILGEMFFKNIDKYLPFTKLLILSLFILPVFYIESLEIEWFITLIYTMMISLNIGGLIFVPSRIK